MYDHEILNQCGKLKVIKFLGLIFTSWKGLSHSSQKLQFAYPQKVLENQKTVQFSDVF